MYQPCLHLWTQLLLFQVVCHSHSHKCNSFWYLWWNLMKYTHLDSEKNYLYFHGKRSKSLWRNVLSNYMWQKHVTVLEVQDQNWPKLKNSQSIYGKFLCTCLTVAFSVCAVSFSWLFGWTSYVFVLFSSALCCTFCIQMLTFTVTSSCSARKRNRAVIHQYSNISHVVRCSICVTSIWFWPLN